MEKILNRLDKVIDSMLSLKVSLIVLLCGIIILTPSLICFEYYLTEKSVKEIFEYSELEYQNLENEAKKIVETKNFDTDYEYEVTKYNNKSQLLEFEMKSDNQIESITVTVENYKTSDESVKIIRFANDKSEQAKKIIEFNMGLAGFTAILLWGIIILIMFLIMLLLKFCSWIIKLFKKKKD